MKPLLMQIASSLLLTVTAVLVTAGGAAAKEEQVETAEFTSSAITDTELQTYRGGFTNPTVMVSSLSAILEGNSAEGTASGANSIDGGAFNNANGLINVIQNSGNNVIVQSLFQVNVNIQ